MIPAAFEYHRPTSVDDALALLAEHGSDAKLLAGGMSLLPLMKLRLARPERLIDIGRLGDLRGVRRLDDGSLAIGALTTYAELLANPEVTVYALLADALPGIGDIQVRNAGTIGGAVAHADPAADLPACLLALEAEVVARSQSGERTIPIDECITGAFASSLRPDELVVEIRLPAPSGAFGSAYRSLEQPASGYALAGAAVVVGPGVCRIGITGVGEHVYRATAAEQAFVDGGDAAAAGAHATDGVTVNSDIHADTAYRAALAATQVRRAIETAVARAG